MDPDPEPSVLSKVGDNEKLTNQSTGLIIDQLEALY